ncbi:SDR family NAD(P)-dependent oxidoreductase [Nocardia sp. ET3-3]|uniref:3-dehydrosphinganine reductase n=1 Tax=Nocardia terrae TaxID=2675851 RepID=A0A7K1USM8_9NOCA|nr:SDR family oxidoreductase [Nocardia terrae]MVU77353.1 SDR family NAD(P)-dependent oxidoreductase [Nocardia terrae]
MVFDWTSEHVIVTGGSEGIGAAVAEAFARRGAAVSILARRRNPLRERAETIGAQWATADVTQRDELTTAIKELEHRQGPCTVLACCAGLTLPGRFLDIDPDEFDTQITANYLGSVHAIRAVLPGMTERRSGRILLISSTSAFLGIAGYTSYGPTKASIRQLALCLRYETDPTGVHVAVLYPADTDTPGLTRENLRKPPETKAITGSIKPLPAETVARAALRGLERNHHHITTDPLTRFFLLWANLPEDLARPFFRRSIAKARTADR